MLPKGSYIFYKYRKTWSLVSVVVVKVAVKLKLRQPRKATGGEGFHIAVALVDVNTYI